MALNTCQRPTDQLPAGTRPTSTDPMSFKPSRPDLFRSNFERHLNECKSIITFLGSFTSFSYVRESLNEHIDKLEQSTKNM